MADKKVETGAQAFASIVDEVLTCQVGKRSNVADAVTLQVAIGKLPASSLVRLLEYGFQRHINDGLGGADVAVETKQKLAQDKLEVLKKGYVAGRVSGPKAAATPEQRAQRYAVAEARKAFIAARDKATWDAMDSDKQTDTLAKISPLPDALDRKIAASILKAVQNQNWAERLNPAR